MFYRIVSYRIEDRYGCHRERLLYWVTELFFYRKMLLVCGCLNWMLKSVTLFLSVEMLTKVINTY